MLSESRIRGLCDQIAACSDEDRVLSLTGELQAALQDHIQDARGKLLHYPHLHAVLSDLERRIEA